MSRLAENIRGFQIRGARGLLNMSISRLAREAGVSEEKLKAVEGAAGPVDLPPAKAEAIIAAFDRYGVRFTHELSTRYGVRIDLATRGGGA